LLVAPVRRWYFIAHRSSVMLSSSSRTALITFELAIGVVILVKKLLSRVSLKISSKSMFALAAVSISRLATYGASVKLLVLSMTRRLRGIPKKLVT